jgi:hypothetical protein
MWSLEFDAFVAIDWSGAAHNYSGVAVAVCNAGQGQPRLVAPRHTRWKRYEVAEWIETYLKRGRRLLIGFDFAFAFPFEDCGYLGGQAAGVECVFDLWALIESRCAGAPDFGCNPFVAYPDYAELFWKTGRRPERWIERKRRTEHACAETTQTRPDTLYKLLHSKQVGKGSITGMRVLHQLRSSVGDDVAVWPFEAPRRSVIVEIYPTLFRKMATGSVAKLRSIEELNGALKVLRSNRISKAMNVSDHETDALVSAAGLRMIARDPKVWAPAELKSPRVRREGWIFGV